jgi:hypothetical protein
MKRLVQRISLPLLLWAGLTLIGPQAAEAAKWRRYAPRPYVPQPYSVAPAAVYVPPVRVYAPRVGVSVGPGVYVRAPGVRVNIGSPYPLYRGPYYFGW